MRRKFSERHQLTTVSELNVTPLLDLAFVLLIIFMITTPLIENSTDLVLPTGADKGTPVNTDRVHAVSIHADGHFSMDGKPATLDDVESALAGLVAQDAETAVLIRGHHEIQLQKFTDVLETAKRAGVKKIGIGNTPKAD